VPKPLKEPVYSLANHNCGLIHVAMLPRQNG